MTRRLTHSELRAICVEQMQRLAEECRTPAGHEGR
jgi:hypothetical protein